MGNGTESAIFISIIEKRKVSMSNKTFFRSFLLNRTTPPLAAKAKIVLFTF